jgi:hypothetical protein
MAPPTLRNDNSKPLAATLQQLYLALEECFKMNGEDQCVVIEKLGDITQIDSVGGIGVEVKVYDKSNKLTDGHSNWWNTVRNWLQDDPRLARLTSLVLWTTQPLGESERLADWNASSASQRLDLMREIHQEAKSNFEQKQAKDKSLKPSKTLEDMQFVMSDERRKQLLVAIQKIVICADMPGFQACYDRLKLGHAKGIPSNNQSQFIGSLFEFIVQPATIEQEWTINYRDFADQVCRATKLFGGGKRPFPTKTTNVPTDVETSIPADSLFVSKIHEIEFHKKVPQAMSDYLYAQKIWVTELAAHKTLKADYDTFVDDLKTAFSNGHELASMECSDVIKDSQRFYLRTIGDKAVPEFPNFETPNLPYRNGVLHVIMDSEPEVRWKLEL